VPLTLTGMWGHLAHSALLQPSPRSKSIRKELQRARLVARIFSSFIGADVGGSVSHHASVLFDYPQKILLYFWDNFGLFVWMHADLFVVSSWCAYHTSL
jgi:hypothetical protein